MTRNFAIRFLVTGLLMAMEPVLTDSLASQAFTDLRVLQEREGVQLTGFLLLSDNTLYGTASLGGPGGYAGKGSVFAIQTDGSGFTDLHLFSGSEGASPCGGVILSGNTLYGTTFAGGLYGNGTVFRMSTNGTVFTSLHSFAAGSGSLPSITNSDGACPAGELALSEDTLYGSARSGGDFGSGTLFAVKTNGTDFTNLHSFAPNEDSPNALIVSGGRLYGTTYGRNGSVFALNTDGTGFTNLHFFASTDGSSPVGRLLLSGKTLYGITHNGGASGDGTVFAINTNGTEFATLHSFDKERDGAYPKGGLVLWGDTLYGTANFGLTGTRVNNGIVFAVNTDGTGFTTLHTFTVSTNEMNTGGPLSGLTLSGNRLYGTTFYMVFSLAVDIRLSIVPYDQELILTWPTIPSGFTLQSASNLESPVWTTVSPGPVTVNGQYMVIHRSSGGQQFFRLSQ